MKRLIVAVLISLFLFQAGRAIVSQSATFDEVQYFGIGAYLMQNGKWDVMGAILHPPLAYYLSSVPLLFVRQDESVWHYEEKERGLEFLGAIDYFRGQKLLSADENRHDRLLIASRCAIALLGILLGWYIYRFGRELHGEWGGVLSLALFAFCPNLLAHAGIIGPDFPLTVFTLIAVYYLWRTLTQGGRPATLLAGFFLGLALLCKFTALLLIPSFALTWLIWTRYRPATPWRPLLVIVVAAVAVLACGYQFRATPFIDGIRFQLLHADAGHDAFLMGDNSSRGWWYYYLVAFMIKTPAPTILLILAALAGTAARLRRGVPNDWLLLAPVLVIAGFFSLKHQSIGLRYILPVYPFLYLMAGGLLREWKWANHASCLLIAWLAVSTTLASPRYLAYFNELIGGPDNGYRYLVDSNLDWGQGLKELKSYMDANGIGRVTLSYFGADSPERYGISYDWLPSLYLFNPEPDRDWKDIPRTQPLVVSATNLQGVYFDDKNLFKWLSAYRPTAVIGHCMFVYDPAKIDFSGRWQ